MRDGDRERQVGGGEERKCAIHKNEVYRIDIEWTIRADREEDGEEGNGEMEKDVLMFCQWNLNPLLKLCTDGQL